MIALAASAGAVAVGAMTAKQTEATLRDQPPIGDFVEVTGGRIHYVQKGTGPHVVLLHGAGGNLREFTFDLVDRLSDDFTVTAFDRPGMGYSDQSPDVAQGAFATQGDSPHQQAAMLREASGLIGITDPIVAGHSFGGIVAMGWADLGLAEQSPVNAAAIVSFAGVLMPWPDGLGRYYTVNGSALGGAIVIPIITAVASDQQIVDTVASIFAPDPIPDGYLDAIGTRIGLRPAVFRANVRQVNTLRPHVVDLLTRYPQLTLPIEIIHGTADKTVPDFVHPQEFIKIVDSANYVSLPGIGHMPHQADPQAAVDAIMRAATRAGLR